VGHPAFGDLTPGGSPEFLTPAAGVIRALDLAINEYQGGQDFVATYDTTTGQLRPGWPAPVNDLEFLTGPSVGDIDGLPGEEVVGGTASMDLYGFNSAGVNLPGFSKLTADWTVTNPILGSFGTFDLDSSAHKVLVGLTRAGSLLAYDTDAGPCTPSSWPRFHHDNASSGDYRRDATLPGKPYDVSLDGNTLTFKAPGEDLMCGTVDHYEVVQSNATITGSNFSAQEPASGAPAPAAPGTQQSMQLPPERRRFIAVRAVDEQGNVGPPAVTEVPSYVRPRGATPLRVSLVPAYRQCTSPDRTHGPSLTFPSCSAPQQTSAHLTVGTFDANGKPPGSVGSARFDVHVGDPATSADEADVGLSVSLTDVRRTGDLSDYTGELQLAPLVRITDRFNGPSQGEPATTQDSLFDVTVPCAATAGDAGGTCSLSTSFDAVRPGSVPEGKRAIWALDTIELRDGGADGLAATGPNALFARQGIFIP
jgi:hypothetical protein